MSSPRSTRASYDAIARAYADTLGDELAGKPLDRGLLDAFADRNADGVVADVGAGPGQIGAYVAGHGGVVVASDLSVQMCRTGAEHTGLPFVAADMTALPFASAALSGIVCFYAVIHLDGAQRERAYREFARVLRPGGQALVSFHTSDADAAQGSAWHATEMMGHDVDLTFHFLDPDAELARLSAAGLGFAARLDRAPHPGSEHPSMRSYLLVERGLA